MTINMSLLRDQVLALHTLRDTLTTAGVKGDDVPYAELEGVANLLDYLRDEVELPGSKLRSHSGPGHLCEVATYGPEGGDPLNVAIECVACGVVLIDFDLTGEGVSDV